MATTENLTWRFIDPSLPATEVCNKCDGTGKYMYANTNTYMSAPGLLSGQAITEDLCDQCWGSGQANRPYTDVRALREELRALKKAQN